MENITVNLDYKVLAEVDEHRTIGLFLNGRLAHIVSVMR